jgi:hypothetical protein
VKLAVVRDTPRWVFVLVADGRPVAEFETEAEAWQFAEDQFGVAQAAQSSQDRKRWRAVSGKRNRK